MWRKTESLERQIAEMDGIDFEWVPWSRPPSSITQTRSRFLVGKIDISVTPVRIQGPMRSTPVHYLSDEARQPSFMDVSDIDDLRLISPEEHGLMAPLAQPSLKVFVEGEELDSGYFTGLDMQTPIYVGETWAKKSMAVVAERHGTDTVDHFCVLHPGRSTYYYATGGMTTFMDIFTSDLDRCHPSLTILPSSSKIGDKNFDEFSTLVQAEAVVSLPSMAEENTTSMALEIEEIVVAKYGDLSQQILHLMERYVPEGPVVAANNGWFAKVKMHINKGRACKDDLHEAYNLLHERLEADNEAIRITNHFHPAYTEQHSFETWDGCMQRILAGEEIGEFSTVLDGFLPACRDIHTKAHYVYWRPKLYVIAAAVDRELSPNRLKELLQPLSRHTWRYLQKRAVTSLEFQAVVPRQKTSPH
ncbi:hypothetical protein AZE42_07534 [Rhizopogon vesiculosus]|uniref:Uncharacterized protein n=1 Tax=Rhizopogon vesiculosus TaxID=180088 RepID=A0A1J8PQR8_9AGAM|nr:hypothetical protein AZE42_07534 [Rhizopogon vesiculosus]